MKEKVGVILFILGLVTAESEILLIPITLLVVGVLMARTLVIGDEKGQDEWQR